MALIHAVSVNPFGQAYDPEDTDTSDAFTTALTEYMVDINFVGVSVPNSYMRIWPGPTLG